MGFFDNLDKDKCKSILESVKDTATKIVETQQKKIDELEKYKSQCSNFSDERLIREYKSTWNNLMKQACIYELKERRINPNNR